MIKLRCKTKILQIIFFISISIFVTKNTNASNGIQAQMDILFNDMSNYSAPGVFETQRRGVLSGGRFITKSKIFDENLVSFSPPSWKAGCGGVDLFGGSMSFINSDQLIQLLRSVAANAKGYAFQLALDNVCPDCSKWIESFQRKVQSLNEYLGNSCQLAQGIVNDLTSGFDLKNKTDASITATTTGLFNDFFEAKQETTGKTPMEELKTKNPEKYYDLIGNIMWKQLKQNDTTHWFIQNGNDELLESIMSLTGTVIIHEIKDETTPIQTLPGNQITLQDLVLGGTVNVYNCGFDRDKCLPKPGKSISTKSINIEGIQTKITDLLLGTNNTNGIIYKYANNTGNLNDAEKNFLANLPNSIGTLIRNLAATSPDAAEIFVKESAGAIALHMMNNFASDLFRVGRLALVNSNSAYKKDALDILNQSKSQTDAEYLVLVAQFGDLSNTMNKYNAILQNVSKQKYLTTLTSFKSVN